MSLFGTNIRTQIQNYLPPEVRGSSWIDLLYSLLYPLHELLQSNVNFESDVLMRLKYNGQKIKLQAALNEIFGITIAPFIYIETRRTFIGTSALILDESEVGETSIVTDETEPGTMLVIDESEETIQDFDFIVYVPLSIAVGDVLDQVRAEVQVYKIAGVNFDVQTY